MTTTRNVVRPDCESVTFKLDSLKPDNRCIRLCSSVPVLCRSQRLPSAKGEGDRDKVTSISAGASEKEEPLMTRLGCVLFMSCSSWLLGCGSTSRARTGAHALLSLSMSTNSRRAVALCCRSQRVPPSFRRQHSTGSKLAAAAASSPSFDSASSSSNRGKLLVLGGTGFLGQAICHRAAGVGYEVTSLSRRGLPPPTTAGTTAAQSSSAAGSAKNSVTIDYRQGDARRRDAIDGILEEGGYVGVIHCIGLLLDGESGLGQYNRFASGSGSVPDADATYDAITRVTAHNAIGAVTEYCRIEGTKNPFPFCFVSAAEAGWPDVAGGTLIESVAPDFLKRYLRAKRSVEAELLQRSDPALLRPVVFRPSLIYSTDRPASYVPVGAFFLGNAVGLPFVDRPVSVQSLAAAIVRAVSMPLVKGIQRYQDIDKLSLQ
jgi:nucleoside-diphosphate-sugar epimerase